MKNATDREKAVIRLRMAQFTRKSDVCRFVPNETAVFSTSSLPLRRHKLFFIRGGSEKIVAKDSQWLSPFSYRCFPNAVKIVDHLRIATGRSPTGPVFFETGMRCVLANLVAARLRV